MEQDSSTLTNLPIYQQPGFIIGMIVIAAIGGYVITSFVLARYPGLLHKKKKIGFSAAHISHRGGKQTLKSPLKSGTVTFVTCIATFKKAI